MKVSHEAAGGLRVRLPPHEADTLSGLVADLLTALEPGRLERADPVYQRLYPDGYQSDPDAAVVFRELTESALAAERRERAQRMIADIKSARPGRRNRIVDLDRDAAQAWLTVLNDLRLAIGTRLDIGEDDPPRALGAADPEAATYVVYGYLTAVQELLVQALMA